MWHMKHRQSALNFSDGGFASCLNVPSSWPECDSITPGLWWWWAVFLVRDGWTQDLPQRLVRVLHSPLATLSTDEWEAIIVRQVTIYTVCLVETLREACRGWIFRRHLGSFVQLLCMCSNSVVDVRLGTVSVHAPINMSIHPLLKQFHNSWSIMHMFRTIIADAEEEMKPRSQEVVDWRNRRESLQQKKKSLHAFQLTQMKKRSDY